MEEKNIKTVSQGFKDVPKCPRCSSELKKRMNKPAGERVYCPNCNYPETNSVPSKGVTINPSSAASTGNLEKKGVRIINTTGR